MPYPKATVLPKEIDVRLSWWPSSVCLCPALQPATQRAVKLWCFECILKVTRYITASSCPDATHNLWTTNQSLNRQPLEGLLEPRMIWSKSYFSWSLCFFSFRFGKNVSKRMFSFPKQDYFSNLEETTRHLWHFQQTYSRTHGKHRIQKPKRSKNWCSKSLKLLKSVVWLLTTGPHRPWGVAHTLKLTFWPALAVRIVKIHRFRRWNRM